MTRDYATVEVIIAVYDSIGTKLYSYTYDPWGRFVRTQVFVTPSTAIVNPYLYRGYYYDSDLGFYYLQSRYYDPNTCRFINADSYVSTGQGILGHNMFAYCGNNPVMRIDPNGEGWILVAVVGILILTLTGCSESTSEEKPTEEQLSQAKSAADHADYLPNSNTNSIDIYIDLSDENQKFDVQASDAYFDRLYENMCNKASALDIPAENLMTRDHIEWEYNIHQKGYDSNFAPIYDACKNVHLNVDETWWTLTGRTFGYMQKYIDQKASEFMR